ncbi:MAG: MFS transporter [Humibacter sp.]
MQQVPLRQVFHGGRGVFLLGMLLAEFGGGMQGLAVSTVLPVVASELHGFALFGATLAAGNIAAVLMLAFSAPLLARIRPTVVIAVATIVYAVGVVLSSFAPSMVWVLAGMVVRGIGLGLITGFGAAAIGGLFDDRERPRVLGLYAFVWIIPSIVGPALNAAIAQWVGWRWAFAWPLILVVGARVLMGAYSSAIPWERRREQVRATAGVVVAALLGVGALASAWTGPFAFGLFAVAGVGAAVGIVAFLARGSQDARLMRTLSTFGALCAAFFGVDVLLSVTVIEALGGGLLWASIAITGALVMWTLAGLRPRPSARPDRVTKGLVFVTVAVAALTLTCVVASGPTGIAIVVVAGLVAGLGMGVAYPLVMSESFEGPAPAHRVGPLVSFAETATAAWAAMVCGGLYSALHSSGAAPGTAVSWAFAILLPIAIVGVVVAFRRRRVPWPASAL